MWSWRHADTTRKHLCTHMEPHARGYTHRVSSSFKDTHARHVRVLSGRLHHRHAHTSHVETRSGTRGCAFPRHRHTAGADVHTHSLMLPDEDAHVWSKALRRHTQDTDTLMKWILGYPQTHRGTNAHTCSEDTDTQRHMDAHRPLRHDTDPSETDPQTPIHLSREICGASTVCQDSSGLETAVRTADESPVGERRKARRVTCARRW